MTHTYQIEGMTCGSCVAKVKSELLKLPDVLSTEINLETKEAVVNMQKHISVAELQNAVAQAGAKYKISEKNSGHVSEGFGTTTAAPISMEEERTWLQTYQPLLLIFAFITGVSLLTSFTSGNFLWKQWMNHFMAGFFLVFSFFKLLNLKAFAESYAMYDVVAKRVNIYGYIYPFIELGLGISFLINFQPYFTNLVTVVVMGISTIGVAQSVFNKQKIQCACLGAVFNLPMSTVTLIEDLLMVGMSGTMLFLMG